MTKNNNKQQQNKDEKRERKPSMRASNNEWTMCERQFINANMSAFSKSASGVCVPDSHPFETSRYDGHISITAGASASGTTNFFLYPSPTCSMISQTGNGNTTVISGASDANASGALRIRACTVANLQTLTSKGRVVACTARIRNNLSFSTIQGKLIITPFMCVGANIADNTWVNSTSNLVANLMSGNVVSSLVYPQAFEVNLDQLIDKDLELHFLPIDPSAFRFRNVGNQTDAVGNGFGVMTGWETFSTTTGLVTASTGTESTNCEGWTGFAVTLTGAPVSGADCIEIEMMFRYEAEPDNSQSLGTLVPAGITKQRERNPHGIDQILTAIPAKLVTMAKPLIYGALASAGKGLLASML